MKNLPGDLFKTRKIAATGMNLFVKLMSPLCLVVISAANKVVNLKTIKYIPIPIVSRFLKGGGRLPNLINHFPELFCQAVACRYQGKSYGFFTESHDFQG